jgi:Glycosyltransferase family 87
MNFNLKLLTPIFLFFAFTVLSVANSDRFQLLDFEVYYKAGQRISEDINPYQQKTDGHFIYKYSPVFALLMSPLTLVSFDVAKWLYLIFLLAIFSLTCIILNHIFTNEVSSPWLGIAAILIFSKHLNKEIILGQINILLLCLFVLSIYYSHTKKLLSAILLVLSIFIKPIGLVLIPYFIFKKDRAWLIYYLCSFLLIFLLSLIFIKLELYSFWITELINELHAKTDLFSIDTQNIFGFIERILHLGRPFNFILGISTWVILQCYLYKYEAKYYPYLLISSIPLLVCTSNNFYILSLPVFIYLINRWNKLACLDKLIFTVSCLLMCFNQYELWGRKGVDAIDYFAPYALSVLMSFLILIRTNKENIY